MAILTFPLAPWNRYPLPGLVYESDVSLVNAAVFSTPSALVKSGTDAPAAGDFLERGDYLQMVVSWFADQVSANDGIAVIGSMDGITDHKTLWEHTGVANTGIVQLVELAMPYVRFTETNGGVTQGIHFVRAELRGA